MTVVDSGLLVHGHVKHAKLIFSGKKYHLAVRKGIAGTVPLGDLGEHEEGTRWVRGHVSEKDEAGAALLTAAALVNEKPPRRAKPLHDTSDAYIKGEISEAEFKSNLDLFDEDLANGYH